VAQVFAVSIRFDQYHLDLTQLRNFFFLNTFCRYQSPNSQFLKTFYDNAKSEDRGCDLGFRKVLARKGPSHLLIKELGEGTFHYKEFLFSPQE
jgi:hypothetical protein